MRFYPSSTELHFGMLSAPHLGCERLLNDKDARWIRSRGPGEELEPRLTSSMGKPHSLKVSISFRLRIPTSSATVSLSLISS